MESDAGMGMKARMAAWALGALLAVPSLAEPLPPPPRPVPAGDRFMLPDRNDLRDERKERKHHRLSPEERRQLRRDIHEAGRDLYPRDHHSRREARREDE